METPDEQQNTTKRNVRKKISSSMSNFTERLPKRVSKEVQMILPDPSPIGNNAFSAFEMNLECAKKASITDREQRATYFLGGICCLIPGIADELQAAVRSMGRRLRIIRIPSDAARNGLTVPPEIMDVAKAISILAYLVTMLYKNVTVSNFGEFSNRRLKALRAVAGCIIKEENLSVFGDVEDAMYFRNSYGQNHQIRKTVMNAVLDLKKESGPCGGVFIHVANFLSWTDMGGYRVVDDFLVYVDSPVLKAPGLATEVSNWNKADRAVKETKFPKYFRILQDFASCSLLKRSNFPTLISVAEKIKIGGLVSNTVNAERSEVDYYVDMHLKYRASDKVGGAFERDRKKLRILMEEFASKCIWPLPNIYRA